MIWQSSTSAPPSDSPSCVQRSSTAYSSLPQRTITTGMPSTSADSGAFSLSASSPPISTHLELMQSSAAPSEHSGLQACSLGHHALVPRRIEGELDACLADRRDPSKLVAHVINQDVPHAAARGGEGDLDVHRPCAVLVLLYVAIVDQAEVDDVDGNLRIVAGAHLFPGKTLHVLGVRIRWQLGGLHCFLADRIGIVAGDAEQVAFEVHGETAAERLGNVTRLARLEFHLLAGGNDHRAHLAVHDEGFVLVPPHGVL